MTNNKPGLTRPGFLRLLTCGGLAAAGSRPSRAATPATERPPAVAGGKGKWFPSEMRRYRDSITGHEVRQLTSSPYDDVNLYFTEQSFTRESKGLVFFSNRTGKMELCYADLKTGRFRQLTECSSGAHGACVCQRTDEVFYVDDGSVCALKIPTLQERKLYTIAKGYNPGMITNVSVDRSGKYVAFAYNRELEAPKSPEATRHSIIVRVNADGSGFQKVYEEDYWISHLLMNPADPDTFLFCHEGPWNLVAQRLWIVQADGSGLRKIREEEEPEVAIGHEHWTEHGGAVGYHGSYKRRNFLGRIRKDGSGQREYTMSAPSGHSSATPDGSMVMGDGTIEFPYISLYHFKGDVAVAEPICSRGKVKNGDIHAHANFSADGQYVVFASATDGSPNVYIVKTRR